jgi:hypothetical protein
MTLLKLGTLWMGLFVIFGLLGIHASRLEDYYSLSRAGVRSSALVVGLKPHEQVEYSYLIKGRNYRGIARTGIANTISYSEIKPGNEIEFFYLRRAPEVSCLGNPKILYDEALKSSAIVSLFFPTFAVCGLWWRKRRWFETKA